MADLSSQWQVIGTAAAKITVVGSAVKDVIMLRKGLEIDPEIANQVNKAQLVDIGIDSMFSGMKLIFSQAIMDLKLLASLVGMSTVQTGTTPNQILTMAVSQGVSFPYFKIEAQADRIENEETGLALAKDVHFVIYKAKITELPKIVLDNGEWVVLDYTAQAIKDTANSDKFWDVIANETKTAIA